MVQDYYSREGGWEECSLVEHPAESDVLILEKRGDLACVKGIWKGGHFIKNGLYFHDEEYARIADLCKEIIDSGLIPEGQTFQLEYGFDNMQLKIFQIRIFREKEERANFDIDFNRTKFLTGTYHSFGVTAKDGIEVPLVYLNKAGINKFNSEDSVAYTFCSPFRRSPDLSLSPENITAFIANSMGRNFLQHGMYRFVQKADVSLVVDEDRWNIDGDTTLNDFGTVRVYSNGIQGGISYV